MYRTDGAKSITHNSLHLIMRTAVSLVCLLLMVPLLGTFSAAEMTNDGTTITITGNETWDSANPIDLDMTVSPGATLEINDATTVTEGVTITVEPDATLAINGDVLGEDLDAGLLVYDDTEINLNFGDLVRVAASVRDGETLMQVGAAAVACKIVADIPLPV